MTLAEQYRQRGIQQGRQEGRQEGKKEVLEQIATVIKLLHKSKSAREISELLNLPIEIIELLEKREN